ncbi:glutamate synthase subunit beta [Deltaproteobacteria bacterium TL4]
MDKSTGFLEIEKDGVAHRPIEERVRDFKEYDLHSTDQKISTQANRCMDCGVPFCHTGCPLGNLIPDWNNLVFQGKWKNAIEALHLTNNFPEFTGRICPAPCEDTCVLNQFYTRDPEEQRIKKNAITIEEIEKRIIEHAWEQGWVQPKIAKHKTGKKIAIIGSGPSGLAAAQQLVRVGHEVTVFEKSSKIGGLLRYGIPDFKLDKRVIDRRLSQMAAEGVVFRTQVNVGVDLTVEELRSSFDAVLLAIGIQQTRKLRVPGAELQGVHYAMEYLPQQNQVVDGVSISAEERMDAKDKKVAVLGGGFTGADCIGTAIRQGANKRIHQFELINMAPKPTPVHEEADMDCRGSILTKKITGEKGQVKALHAVELEWKNENGRMTFSEVSGSEFTLPVDMVLLAMGFVGPKVEGLLEKLGVELSMRGKKEASSPQEVLALLKEGDPMYTVTADHTFMTSQKGIFVAGDARRGASLVVWAIWEGREVACAIDTYLMGTTDLPTSPQAL